MINIQILQGTYDFLYNKTRLQILISKNSSKAHLLIDYRLLLQLFSVNLNMNILRKLFSACKHQASAKIQVQLTSRPAVHQLSNPSALTQQNQNGQTSSFQSLFKQTQIPNQIRTKILHISQLKQKESSWNPDFGALVGVIGRQIFYQNIINQPNLVKIGRSQEINSLQALRKKSLDSLLVFFTESDCQFDLITILLAQQNLIFVLESQKSVQNFIASFQKAFFDYFQDRPLHQSLIFLCVSISIWNNRYFLEFKNSTFFLDYFRNCLKEAKIDFGDVFQIQRLVKMIKLKDYLDFRQSKQSTLSKIISIKQQIEQEISDLKKQQEIKRISSLLSTCENQEDQLPIPQPVRKNSSMEADIEAEYFNKRLGQVHTVEMAINEIIDSSDLFYFIEEQDNNDDQDDSQLEGKYRFTGRKAQKRIHRSKSLHSFELTKQEDLDDEFFNKY